MIEYKIIESLKIILKKIEYNEFGPRLEASVGFGNGVVGVGQDGNLHLAEPALFAVRVGPRQVGENRV